MKSRDEEVRKRLSALRVPKANGDKGMTTREMSDATGFTLKAIRACLRRGLEERIVERGQATRTGIDGVSSRRTVYRFVKKGK